MQVSRSSNLAKAISIETYDLLDISPWKPVPGPRNLEDAESEGTKQEIADILIYLKYLGEETRM